MNSLMEVFEKKCIHRHTKRTHPKCFDENGNPLKLKEATPVKVLVFDIETLPLVVYAFDTWNVNILRKHIIKDWCVLSWSAKWLNDDRIMSDVLTPREAMSRNDKRLVSGFWKLIDTADVVVAQNGKKFDIRRLNTRFWKYKLPKPSSYKVIDTLTVARSVFDLTYNGQDFMAEFIGAQEKIKTDFAIWAACDRGEQEALKYMLDYNENDVRGLEQIYLEMREWIPNHPNLKLYAEIDRHCCPICLSDKCEEIGYYAAKSKKYVEYRCKDCRGIWHDSVAVKEK